MKRHLWWIVPIVLLPVIVVGASAWTDSIRSQPGAATDGEAQLAILVLSMVSLIGPVLAVVAAVIGGIITFTNWRIRRGRTSTALVAQANQPAAADQAAAAAWTGARALRALLVAREVPPAIAVWDVVPNVDEIMLFDVAADYARYYGRDVSYSQSGGFFFGHPAFVLTGLAATGISNAARRNRAQNESREAWREWQSSRVIVTNQRLVCHAGGRWLSFYYSGMTSVYPEVDRWTLVCQFGDTEPLLLSGHNAPLISLMTVLRTHGPDAVAQHPSLQPLA